MGSHSSAFYFFAIKNVPKIDQKHEIFSKISSQLSWFSNMFITYSVKWVENGNLYLKVRGHSICNPKVSNWSKFGVSSLNSRAGGIFGRLKNYIFKMYFLYTTPDNC